jgi:inorganic pyrophosphatase/exopolyphosphatase
VSAPKKKMIFSKKKEQEIFDEDLKEYELNLQALPNFLE